MNVLHIMKLKPSQTAPLVPLFREGGHIIAPNLPDEHAFVIARLINLSLQAAVTPLHAS